MTLRPPQSKLPELSATSSSAALLGRALLTILFVVSGVQKITSPAATAGYIAAHGLPLPYIGVAIAVCVELGAGVLLLAGLAARPVSLLMAAFTLTTAVLFHDPLIAGGDARHFMKNLSIAGGLLQIAAFGAGRFSIDGLFRRRSQLRV